MLPWQRIIANSRTENKTRLWLYNMHHTEHSMLPMCSLETPTGPAIVTSVPTGILLAQTVHHLLCCNVYQMRCQDHHEQWGKEIQALVWKVWGKPQRNRYLRCKQLPNKNSTSWELRPPNEFLAHAFHNSAGAIPINELSSNIIRTGVGLFHWRTYP